MDLIAFTLALTCLSFDNPQRPALLCLGIIIALYLKALRKAPPTLRILRAMNREEDNDELKETIKYLEKNHGIKSLFRDCSILLIGLGVYLFVLSHPVTLEWFTK